MSKLKCVSRPVTVKSIEEDMYHRCSYCHYFENGKCTNNSIVKSYQESLEADLDEYIYVKGMYISNPDSHYCREYV